MLWGSHRTKQEAITDGKAGEVVLVTDGSTCWYDMQLWRGKYSHWSLSEWKANRKKDDELNDDCNLYVHWMVEQLLSNNDNGKSREDLTALDYPEPWELVEQDIKECVWIESPEEFKEEQQWKDDPANVGKKVTEDMIVLGPDNLRLVKVFVRLWRREWRHIKQGVKRRSKNRAQDAIGQDFMDSQQMAIVKNDRGKSSTSAPQLSSSSTAAAAAAPARQGAAAAPVQVTPNKPSKAGSDAEEESDGGWKASPSPPAVGRKLEVDAKAKAKAKTKAKSGSGGGGGAKNKGRPIGDPGSLLRAGIREMGGCDVSSIKYFGVGPSFNFSVGAAACRSIFCMWVSSSLNLTIHCSHRLAQRLAELG